MLSLLSGCLDLEQHVKINADGSGFVTMIVSPGKHVALSVLKNERFLGVIQGHHQVKDVVKEGKFQHRESVEFTDLREVGFKNETIFLHVQRQGVIGFRTARGTFEHSIIPEKTAPQPSRPQEDSARLAGHTFTYKVELPGPIQQAEVATIGTIEVEPTVHGNTAVWIIPLEILAGPADGVWPV
jgi:hypothetical protein